MLLWRLWAVTEYHTAPRLADQDTAALFLVQSVSTETLEGAQGTAGVT